VTVIRLLIFDLDGTLVDTSEDITRALNYALKPFGYPPLSNEQTKKLVGDGISRLIEKVIGEGRREFEQIRQSFLDYYGKHIADHSRPYPDVVETLERLKDYKKAVVTNKREALARALFRQLDLNRFFDLIVGSDTTDETKPSPVPLQYVLGRLGVSPEEAVMIGDGLTDIKAGRAAGVRTVGVGYGYKGYEELKGADFFVKESIKEVIVLLERLKNL